MDLGRRLYWLRLRDEESVEGSALLLFEGGDVSEGVSEEVSTSGLDGAFGGLPRFGLSASTTSSFR